MNQQELQFPFPSLTDNKTGGYIPNDSQEQRVLEILRGGQWVRGVDFLNGKFGKPILQYHARIFGLQKKGWVIEGEFVGSDNFKSYRLVRPDKII